MSQNVQQFKILKSSKCPKSIPTICYQFPNIKFVFPTCIYFPPSVIYFPLFPFLPIYCLLFPKMNQQNAPILFSYLAPFFWDIFLPKFAPLLRFGTLRLYRWTGHPNPGTRIFHFHQQLYNLLFLLDLICF